MSIATERATMALHKMVYEMNRKGIELARIIKCATQLLMIGITPNSISNEIVEKCVKKQNKDGGWVSVVDTIWNTKFLSYYSKYSGAVSLGLDYLIHNKVECGFGRSKRDIGRIPVTGLALYLHPQLASNEALYWLENLWISEKNGLTYKAAYILMAFKNNTYKPTEKNLIKEIMKWLSSQQEESGGFAPWKNHPVGPNVYCTGLALIGLLQYIDVYPEYLDNCRKAYEFLCKTQLINGIWPYHEIEDGAAWGLAALIKYEERYLNE